MATSKEYIEFVCDSLHTTGDVSYKKMFGEYMVYIDRKPMLLVCDDTVFVKMLPELFDVMSSVEKGFPYEGAKEHYILDIENESLVNEVVNILKNIAVVTKNKKRKG